jgi:hypothetical protein
MPREGRVISRSDVSTRCGGCSRRQLAAVKVSKSNFQPKQRKFRRHFKGVFFNRNMEVRILPGQPGTLAFSQAPRETREWAGNAGFSRGRFRLQTPKSVISGRQLAKVSGHVREYSRFAEIVGGDWVQSRLPPRCL